MIKNIVFDLSRVLIQFNTEECARDAGVPEEWLEEFRNNVYRSVPWLAMERGTVVPQEAISKMCENLPKELHASVEDTVLNWWRRGIKPVPGMADLLFELKQAGYGIYVLSNARECVHEYFPAVPGADLVDGALFSIDAHALKPEREIFELFFNKFALIPNECYFIDDVTSNVEASENAGMMGTVFRNNVEMLRKKMRKDGIRI